MKKMKTIAVINLKGGQYDIPTGYVIMSIKLKEGLH